MYCEQWTNAGENRSRLAVNRELLGRVVITFLGGPYYNQGRAQSTDIERAHPEASCPKMVWLLPCLGAYVRNVIWSIEAQVGLWCI